MTYSLLYNDLVIHMDEYGVVRIYLSLRKCPAVGFIRSVFLDFMIHGGSAVMALIELNGNAEHHLRCYTENMGSKINPCSFR